MNATAEMSQSGDSERQERSDLYAELRGARGWEDDEIAQIVGIRPDGSFESRAAIFGLDRIPVSRLTPEQLRATQVPVRTNLQLVVSPATGGPPDRAKQFA